MKKVNIGIVGAGSVAVPHAKGFVAIPNKAKIVAVLAEHEFTAKEKAKEWGPRSGSQISKSF
jgi:predicted dehydrogenase